MAFSYPKRKRGKSALLLEDGSLHQGFGIGAQGTAIGELCFNTTMSGYQEVLSDPSYAEQIIVFSFPHIGNVGVCQADDESDRVYARGCVFAQKPSVSSSWRSEDDLSAWLTNRGVIGIYGLDTRALVRGLRDGGAQKAAIINEEKTVFSKKACLKKIQSWSGLLDKELAREVGSKKQYQWSEKNEDKDKRKLASNGKIKSDANHKKDEQLHIVAIDFGSKRHILRCLSKGGAKVTVVPPTSSDHAILQLKPDGIFLSNGPGDPAASARYADSMLKPLLATNIPIFGICLGFQLLSHAFGARSEKMSFGHHGANHPVQEIQTGRVEITSQNHGFAVPADSLPDEVEATHVSLFDGTLEGFQAKKLPVFAVQYHPEASPGPHDAQYLFNRFFNDCRKYNANKLNSRK